MSVSFLFSVSDFMQSLNSEFGISMRKLFNVKIRMHAFKLKNKFDTFSTGSFIKLFFISLRNTFVWMVYSYFIKLLC